MADARVLVVDDKENMLRLFEKILADGYALTLCSDGSQALARLAEQRFDVVITDLRLPGADGLAILKEVRRQSPDTEVIVMTAYASVQTAVEAIKLGAYDYLQKPFDPDAAGLVVARAVERRRLRAQTASLRREIEGLYGLHNLVGKSPSMREVYTQIEQCARLDITTLVTGETGTGKELAARAIHYQSGRREGRFVPVNCGALPSELVESELFGHARGAFTGASAAKPGLFEEAQGGTLFLDEIGDLPLGVQVKLNRALQEKEIRRVGETAPINVDVRVIAATNRDLRAEVAAGRFREDLFYRLNVFPIRLPPLRERGEDIPLLAAHFARKHAQAYQRPVEGLEPEALRALLAYSWPGNVRELENAIERAVVVAAGPRIGLIDLPAEVRERSSSTSSPSPQAWTQMTYREALAEVRDRFTKDYLTALLRETGGNVTRAAERAGMERESLHRLMKRYDVRGTAARQSASRPGGAGEREG